MDIVTRGLNGKGLFDVKTIGSIVVSGPIDKGRNGKGQTGRGRGGRKPTQPDSGLCS